MGATEISTSKFLTLPPQEGISKILEGPNHSTEDIPNFEVTPGILAILKCPKIPLINQRDLQGQMCAP